MTVTVYPPEPIDSTFTPGVAGDTTAGTYTYSVRLGRFQKEGRKVAFNLRLTISAITVAGTGNLIITGFPYTVGSTNAERGTGWVTFAANFNGFVTPRTLYLSSSTTTGILYRSATADARDSQNTVCVPGDLTATTTLAVSGFYFID